MEAVFFFLTIRYSQVMALLLCSLVIVKYDILYPMVELGFVRLGGSELLATKDWRQPSANYLDIFPPFWSVYLCLC